MALRLFPAECAIAALLAFQLLAFQFSTGRAALMAVAVFAVSYNPWRHGGEVKPYATDLLVAVLLLMGAVAWLREPSRRSLAWAFLAMLPFALGLSHPSVFVAAGVMPVVGWSVWRSGDRKAMGWWVAVGAVLVGCFGAYFLLATGGQSADVGRMYREGYWNTAFPPLSRPWKLPLWLLEAHTGEAFGYPVGGENFASLGTALLMIAGLRALWSSGRKAEAMLLLGPMGATFLASAIGKYPYGAAARTMQHIAPTACLLVGLGADRLIGKITIPRRRALVFRGAMAGLAAIGLGLLSFDLARPYRTKEDRASRDFAQWFWPEQARGAQVKCVKDEIGATFDGTYWKLGRWELYLAGRELYSRTNAPAGDRTRYVVFNDFPETNERLREWLDEMRRSRELTSVRDYRVNPGVFDRGMAREEHYRVYEFRTR